MAMRNKKESSRSSAASTATRGGSYALLLSVIVLAILVVVNIFVSLLPVTLTKFDISSSKLYSITSNTKAVVNNLTDDVTIYWIVQSGEEDEIIENLLDKYDSLSDHIDVVKRNPDVYPTFAEQYTDGTVYNNSLVVTSGSRYRYISFTDIYLTESDIYSYTYNTSFDGEGAITSAIDYVTSEDLPTVYLLEGHGEGDLPSTFASQMEKENIETAQLSLLNIDEIPEDAAAILIYAPTSDISEDERELLFQYIQAGGKLLVMAGPGTDGLPETLFTLLEVYGVEIADGIVVEADREHYLLQQPLILLPDLKSDEITDPFIEGRYYISMPLSAGLTVTQDVDWGTVTELMTTSDEAYSKVSGYAMETIEKEEDDIDGPFTLAVSIETSGGGQMIWFASSKFIEDSYNAFSSGANADLAMNAVSALIGEREALSIRSKSLNYNYLTISASTSSLLKVLMIGVFPLVYLGIGIAVVLRRRSTQHETA